MLLWSLSKQKLTLGFECSLNTHSSDCGMKNILIILGPVWSGVWPYHGRTVLCVCQKKSRCFRMISTKISFISQRAMKVVSDSPWLVDFAVGLVNSVLNLPDGQARFLGEFKLHRNCNQSCLSKHFFGQVEMTFGLLHVSYSFPEWQALNLTFFAPWSHCLRYSFTLTGLLYPQLWELALFWPTF